ncbi:MAG: hypothetical protein II802_03215 [Clostridia bacterium]|nr:hypothetical protein [Clostridia bacterium]
MHFNDREEIIALTPLWKGERLPDGRPEVEDKYLDALYGMTLEEVCLPGDIVFGAGGGVLFIPSHLVADVVEGAAKTHVKDDFGFEMIGQGKFTTAQIDRNTWSEEMLDMLIDWIKTDPRGEEYRDLDWSKEYDLARNGDPNDTQTAL